MLVLKHSSARWSTCRLEDTSGMMNHNLYPLYIRFEAGKNDFKWKNRFELNHVSLYRISIDVGLHGPTLGLVLGKWPLDEIMDK